MWQIRDANALFEDMYNVSRAAFFKPRRLELEAVSGKDLVFTKFQSITLGCRTVTLLENCVYIGAGGGYSIWRD